MPRRARGGCSGALALSHKPRGLRVPPRRHHIGSLPQSSPECETDPERYHQRQHSQNHPLIRALHSHPGCIILGNGGEIEKDRTSMVDREGPVLRLPECASYRIFQRGPRKMLCCDDRRMSSDLSKGPGNKASCVGIRLLPGPCQNEAEHPYPPEGLLTHE